MLPPYFFLGVAHPNFSPDTFSFLESPLLTRL